MTLQLGPTSLFSVLNMELSIRQIEKYTLLNLCANIATVNWSTLAEGNKMCTLLWITDFSMFHPYLETLEEGMATLLQYFCPESPMDSRAPWATVCKVTKSQTQLMPEHITCTHTLKRKQKQEELYPDSSVRLFYFSLLPPPSELNTVMSSQRSLHMTVSQPWIHPESLLCFQMLILSTRLQQLETWDCVWFILFPTVIDFTRFLQGKNEHFIF